MKREYKDEKLRQNIKETYNLKIRQGLQDKHIKGTPNYNQEVANGKYKSYLLDGINPQELVNEYACTGEFIRDSKDNWTNKEKIILPFDIGYVYDYENSEYKTTNRMFIHYSKNKGNHIVPRKKGDGIMISIEKMWECEGKHLKIIFTDGRIWNNKYCDCYLNAEEDDEEPMLEFGNVIVNQSEIKSVEILDYALYFV